MIYLYFTCIILKKSMLFLILILKNQWISLSELFNYVFHFPYSFTDMRMAVNLCEFFRPDKMLQRLVYKMVPGLYSNEMQRRRQFYLNTEIESSTDTDVSCDQALALHDQQRPGHIYYSPDDSISLSLEYYIR